MRKLALLLAAGVFAASAFAGPIVKKGNEANKYWVINVGLFKGTDDLDTAGVDTGFAGSIDYFFGNNGGGNSNSEWYAGLGGFTGDGDGDFKFRSFGVHVGVLIGFGKAGDDNPWALDLRGGFYEARAEGTIDVTKAGTQSFDEKETGFGGSAAIVFKSKSGPRFSLGWFTSPEVNGDRGTGYFFTVGFPLNSK